LDFSGFKVFQNFSWIAGYMLTWFTCLQTVNHFSTVLTESGIEKLFWSTQQLKAHMRWASQLHL